MTQTTFPHNQAQQYPTDPLTTDTFSEAFAAPAVDALGAPEAIKPPGRLTRAIGWVATELAGVAADNAELLREYAQVGLELAGEQAANTLQARYNHPVAKVAAAAARYGAKAAAPHVGARVATLASSMPDRVEKMSYTHRTAAGTSTSRS